MFALGIFIGLYSYSIFLLGILHLLYKPQIVFVSIFWMILLCIYTFFHRKSIFLSFHLQKIEKILLGLILLQAVVNYIGVLGPELSFDALWYHLTLPKIFLDYHKIFHIGGNLYYSDMPKLIEMIYIPALAIGNDILAKNVHFIFGLLCCITLYVLGKKSIGKMGALLAAVIFYANLVVGWESITAYIDLGRTFFELLSFYSFFMWIEKKKDHYLFLTATFVGLAITAKLIAVGSLGIFCVLILLELLRRKKSLSQILSFLSLFIVTSLLIPSPWFIFSYLHTHNPFYPLFTNTYPSHFSFQILNPFAFIFSFLQILFFSQDPISPLYIMSLPVIIFYGKKIFTLQPYILLYSLLGIIVWYVTPQTGGGRFLLAYLPIFSLLVAFIIEKIVPLKVKKIMIWSVIVTAVISIFYRGAANIKYIPVIFGKEPKAYFMQQHLNFNFGDFYDIDGYFARTIKPTDRVLLQGFHNEYYVDFHFTDASWNIKNEPYNYIVVQHGFLPTNCTCWKPIYKNNITDVILYKYIK